MGEEQYSKIFDVFGPFRGSISHVGVGGGIEIAFDGEY